MKKFWTQGRVYPAKHYVVSRADELADFITRVKEGRYIVLFAPRQTGKTTFFRWALEKLEQAEPRYFPIHLDFQVFVDIEPAPFYRYLGEDICRAIEKGCQRRGLVISDALTRFLEDSQITDHVSMRGFFREFVELLNPEKDNLEEALRVVIIIDEFEGIPPGAVRGFLHALRQIYRSDEGSRCHYSVGIVGVKNLTQLNYDRTISPFNIQDEFALPNFTLAQVEELLGQYTAEVGQPFAPAVIENVHRQTAGQPMLVNRLAQILTEEMDIPKTTPIDMQPFSKAHWHVLRERNVNIQHLTTNVRRDARFESRLMQIASYDEGVEFDWDDNIISELATYGVIVAGEDGMCEIANPIYLYRILRTFKPPRNGLEEEYYPQDTGNGYRDCLTPEGQIDMAELLNNFRDFIARVGFRILHVPQKPKEYVGQHLLFAYLEQVVRQVQGVMHLEVQTGRGRIDLLVNHRNRKYIVETKIWQGEKSYRDGIAQLAAYLKLEQVTEGYYVVFDHRAKPQPRVKTETLEGLTIRSYVIPVMQERPSASGGAVSNRATQET